MMGRGKYTKVGWAIGNGRRRPGMDAVAADSLYDLLEQRGASHVLPAQRKGHRSHGWHACAEVWGGLELSSPPIEPFREHTEKYYLPAATAHRKRVANSDVPAEEVVK